MYFHISILIFVIRADDLDTVLLTMNICTFFYLCGNICFHLPRFFCFIFFCFFILKSEWNESCTESISYMQVNSSIIRSNWSLKSFFYFFCQQVDPWGPSSGSKRKVLALSLGVLRLLQSS